MERKSQDQSDTSNRLCRNPEAEGDHAAVIRRMIDESPPFRPDATPVELVAEFANAQNRMPALLTLYSRGPEVLPAVRNGLGRANWHVRRWCEIFADNFADRETLHALKPQLRDPKAEVRLWAVHSLACENCKDGPNPIDAVPLLLERIEQDTNTRVRQQAVAMLAHHRSPDARVVPVFKKVSAEESDRKLWMHAEQGLKRYSELGFI